VVVSRFRFLAGYSKTPAQTVIRTKAIVLSIDTAARTGTNLAFSNRSMAPIWMPVVPEAGADRMFSIEGSICRGDQRTSVSAAAGRMLGQSQRASPTRFACGKGEVGCGMTPRCLLFKGTFEFEMHLML
jgi:hypothetical protein